MPKYVLAIDQGTTGTTALVLDQRLAVKGKRNVEFRQIFPRPGWVEHDFEDIWDFKESLPQQSMVAVIHAHRTLEAGFTTVTGPNLRLPL